jgi:hypothetical protein
MPGTTIRVSKLDAAKRQLRVAITLWFTGGDPVAIHTLVSAAHEIVHTLFKRKGLTGLMFDSPTIRSERRGDFAKLIKQYATFFKHAQRDPDGEIDFNPELNDMLLLVTVHGIWRVDEPRSGPELILSVWFQLHEPDLFPRDIFAGSLPIETVEEFRGLGKQQFFEACEIAFGREL